MSTTLTFAEQLADAYERLTPAQQQMAKYILDRKEQVAFMTAKQLAESIGQSDAAVIRFSQAIGFVGFMALRESLRESLLQRVGEGDLPQRGRTQNEQELKSTVFETDSALVQQTAQRNSDEVVSDVANMLVSARRVYVSGHGTSYSLAVYLAMQLNHCIGKGELLTMGTGDMAERLRSINERDVVIGIGYVRYLPYTIDTLKAAQSVGAQTVAITDRASSPLSNFARKTLYVARAVSSPIWWSQAGTLALANWIVALVMHRDSETAEAQLRAGDEMLNRLGHWQSAGNSEDELLLSPKGRRKK